MSDSTEQLFAGDIYLSGLPDAISKGANLDILPYFPSTLVEMIQIATRIAPDKGILYVDEQGKEDLQTYPDLLREAGCVLKGLREKGLTPGDKLVIQIEDDRLFITAFWGGILGGFIPVPLALPSSFPISEGFEKLIRVWGVLDDIHIISDQPVEFYNELDPRVVLPVQELLSHDSDQNFYKPDPDDIAYLQFSSGSTGDPKGAILTHKNLISNIFAIIRASANEEEQKIVDNLFGRPPEVMDYPVRTCSWLPYSHDMGLIGFHITPLCIGMLQIKMTTKTFVMNPGLNIKLIDKYRVTQVPSPNFGLLWMLAQVKDEDIKDVDLSCIEILYNGAEPISATAVRLFIDRFSKYGFDPKAMYPVYGMAEATLLASAPPVWKESVYHLIDRDVFSKKHIVTPAKEGDPFIEFVDEGYPALGMEIRIVDDDDNIVKETMVGHVQIKGSNVIKGYYNNDEANKDLFCGEWLRTGDLGFIKDGRLTVTGRHKDVIFVNAQNYYSTDLEEEIQLLPFVGFRNMAICGVTDHVTETEKIILFIKSRKSHSKLLDMLSKINEHLGKKIGIGIDSIIPMDDIPRTTSGKVQRFKLRERYEAGEFEGKEIEKGSIIATEEEKPGDIFDAIISGDPIFFPKYYHKTLTEMIVTVADEVPQRGIIYVDKDGNEDMQTFPELFEEAKCILGGLRAKGLDKGAKVILQIDDPRVFISSFWGAILGGFIPVPLTLPHSFPISEGFEKLNKVWYILDNPYIITDQPIDYYENFDRRCVFSSLELLDHEGDDNLYEPDPEDIAYIQFSSGSTGDPKGVVLTHKNLLVNIYAGMQAAADKFEKELIDLVFTMKKRIQKDPPKICSWLPYTHDMGLIGFHLAPMAIGLMQIKMRTRSFIENPTLYLKLIDKYRAARIASPNFGLLWMVATIKDEDLKDMDLSCVKVLYNGAEPISPTAVRLFLDKFSKYGFDPGAMAPAYGMAEATLMVTVSPLGEEMIYHRLDRKRFGKDHIAIEAGPDTPFIEFVDEGYPAMDMAIRIVNDDDNVVKEGKVGHIQIKGASVTKGYYNNDEANKELFCGDWLRTGDLGFIKDGRLIITGRHKDVIFVNGQNYYSSDLEEEIQLLPFVGFRNMAICGVTDYEDGVEKIILFMKTRRSREKLSDMLTKINEHLGKKIGVGIDSVVPMDDIPRTTSGKIQRFKLRERYEGREFEDKEVKRQDKEIEAPAEQYEVRAERKKDIDVTGLLKSLPLAIAEGDKHLFLAPAIRCLPNVLRIATILSPNSGILHVGEQGEEELQTYSDLLHSAECVLGGLRSKGLSPGTKVILQIENSKRFLSGFWGVVLGGFITVPLPLPESFPVSEGMERISKVCGVLDKFCIITDLSQERYKTLGNVNIFDIRELLEHGPDRRYYRPKPDDIAYIQFSSGSTGDPKGVILTHRNLLSTIDASARGVFDIRGNDFRSALGFVTHVFRRKIKTTKDLGPFGKAISTLAESSLGNLINKSKVGKDVLDTLLIMTGNRISAHMDFRLDDIRIVNWMPYSHDMGLIGFHIAPTLGGFDQVKLEPKTFIQDPALFLRLIDRYRASHVPCPNFGLQWLTTQVRDEDIEGIDLSCIKELVNGSEPISPVVTRAFIDKFKKYGFDERAMFMVYGMAEASLQVTAPPVFEEPVYHRVDKDIFARKQVILPVSSEEDSFELTDVGFPVAGMKIRVVDDKDNVVHENMIGHIQIQGPSVVQGYYNNPEANKNLFCDGWLRTGDLGFIRNDRLVITGRHKDIIFVNGQNFYAHDVEGHIQRIPGMAFKELAICGTRDYSADSEKVILFVKSSDSRDALVSMLSRINKGLVAGTGIKIDQVVSVSDVPRTPSGKIKRYKLREQFEKGEFSDVITIDDVPLEVQREHKEQKRPPTDEEKRILLIWREVLGTDKIGIGDNFFDLGGNSLRATKVISRINEEIGIELPLRTIFENQTIETLVQAIEAYKVSTEKEEYQPIEPLPKQEYYEVSHAQKRLWFLDKIVPGSPFYNIHGAVMLEGAAIDLEILRKALQLVADRHETLRTRFTTIDERPVQVIADSLDLDFPVVDISDLSLKDQDLRIREIIDEEALKPFDLEKGPLFRTKIIRLSETRHAFVICMHHIIADGWSMGILVQEAVSNYIALVEGKPSPFHKLTIQYKDFAHWQNEILLSDAIKAQKAYWLDNLKGELPVLNLPIDHPRPKVQTQNGVTQRINIDLELRDRLRDLARGQNVTLFMLLLAAFKVLLYKLTGQDDIIVGSPIAGRNHKEIEPLIGFFVNVLPMRSDFSGNPKFTDFLQQVKQTALGAYANQDYPFDKLVEVLNPARDISRSPVFDVTFEVREASADPFASITLGKVSLKDITGDDRLVKFDMSVTGYEVSSGITMKFEYNADLFDYETIERMMRYYHNLIKEVVDNPDKALSEIDILSKEERDQLLVKFNDTSADFPIDTCMHELFELQAKKTPDRPAVVFNGNKLTYEGLDKKSNQLASYLKKHGVGNQDLVGIMTERCPEMITAYLGVWKTGGAYVPIDPEYPKERIRYMLEDSGAKVVFTQEALLDRLPETQAEVVSLDAGWAEISKESEERITLDIDPESLAYVIYTSGSTGRPKGSQIMHKNVVNLSYWHINAFALDENDRASQLAGVAFDATVWEIWPYLLSGASVFPLERRLGQMLPEELAGWFEKNKITRAFVPTKLAEVFLSLDLSNLSLKTMFTGGDTLSHIPKRHEFDLINNYGPTETAVVATSGDITGWPQSKGLPPIGKPISNVSIYILDDHLKPVPAGVVGEICIGGAGVGKGYLNDPSKTSESFILNPFPSTYGKDGDLIYKTGDLGRWLEDGNIDFIGRRDYQVEIRGYRVELGEIETVLSGYEGIKECTVLDKVDDKGSARLVAFYVSEKEKEEGVLKSYLREILPNYMIPSMFICLDNLPLTPNGKVDRNSLSKMVDLSTGVIAEYVAPRNETEQAIADIWKEVLGVDRVGIYDNFFDLGGDSIISLQVVSRLNQKGLGIQPRDVLQHQCVAELATIVGREPTLEVDQGTVIGNAPLTPIQRWFFEQDLENRNHFNQGVMFRSEVGIGEDALRKGLQALIDHHDILRVRFKAEDSGYIQEFKPLGEDVSVVVKDVSSDEELRAEVDGLQGNLDILNGPVFRAGLYHMGGSDYLVLVGHHLVVDGVSWRILLQDLMTATGQALGPGAIVLPDKTTSFRDWAMLLEEYAKRDDVIEEASYWRDVLSDSMLDIPIDHDSGVNDIASSDVVSVELSEEGTSSLLRDAHRAYNTEVNDLLLSAFMRTLQTWTGRDDVVFDLEGHGREDIIDGVNISRTVGWFTTIFPVPLSVDRNVDIGTHIKYVKERLHTIPHKGFNFSVLKYMCKADPTNYTGAGISFNYLGQVPSLGSGGSFSLVNMDLPSMIDRHNKRPNLIDVVCIVVGSHLRINFIYSKNKHLRGTIESLALRFKDELSQIISYCLDPNNFDVTPSDFELAGLDQSQLDKLTNFD
ncbi:MAG: amino acid adenylation domain-containing protein [Deltaproteobacteria bacterium]|nr:amino acid adenylation domain-containing protein [Deltaproteobacteria bacterium]